MHYRGRLRVARCAGGTRVSAVRDADAEPLDAGDVDARFDALVDVLAPNYDRRPRRASAS